MKVKISKTKWTQAGKLAGWFKQAQTNANSPQPSITVTDEQWNTYEGHYDELYTMVTKQNMSPEQAAAKILHIPTTSRWEICDSCRGEGTRDNPNLHSVSGPSVDEMMAEDEDFAESYHAGQYDVSCEDCHGSGKRKITEPIFPKVAPEVKQEYDWLINQYYKDQSRDAAEREMRARGIQF